jgi:hypothetical protein
VSECTGDTCSIRQCDEVAIADAEIEADGAVYSIHLCRRHLPMAMGGAIWMELIDPLVLATKEGSGDERE